MKIFEKVVVYILAIAILFILIVMFLPSFVEYLPANISKLLMANYHKLEMYSSLTFGVIVLYALIASIYTYIFAFPLKDKDVLHIRNHS